MAFFFPSVFKSPSQAGENRSKIDVINLDFFTFSSSRAMSQKALSFNNLVSCLSHPAVGQKNSRVSAQADTNASSPGAAERARPALLLRPFFAPTTHSQRDEPRMENVVCRGSGTTFSSKVY